MNAQYHNQLMIYDIIIKNLDANKFNQEFILKIYEKLKDYLFKMYNIKF